MSLFWVQLTSPLRLQHAHLEWHVAVMIDGWQTDCVLLKSLFSTNCFLLFSLYCFLWHTCNAPSTGAQTDTSNKHIIYVWHPDKYLRLLFAQSTPSYPCANSAKYTELLLHFFSNIIQSKPKMHGESRFMISPDRIIKKNLNTNNTIPTRYLFIPFLSMLWTKAELSSRYS